MSHQPSPGPSQTHPQQLPVVAARQKSRSGVAALAEDVKYQSKYKELKRKVKGIEAENDRLQFKVLQAKRSIQRMRLERAILYERLIVVPPSPTRRDNHPLPPVTSGPGVVPQQQSTSHNPSSSRHHRENPEPVDPHDHAFIEYIRTHGNVCVVPGPDGRPVPVQETIGPGVAPYSGHGLQLYNPPGRAAGGHEQPRQLPPLSHLPSVQQFEPTRLPILAHSQHHHRGSPAPCSHPGSSHERVVHSQPPSRSRSRPSGYPQEHPHTLPPFPTENMPPVQHGMQNPPHSAERERDYARRHHDIRDLAPAHDALPPSRIQPAIASPAPLHLSPYASEPAGRTQHTPRASRGEAPERDGEPDRDRDWAERERILARERDAATGRRSRLALERPDYQDAHTSRSREEPPYHPGYGASRSGTPGSRSRSESGYGNADVRGGPDGPYLERGSRHNARSTNPKDEMDFILEDGRSQRVRDQAGPSPGNAGDSGGGSGNGLPLPGLTHLSMDSRKRSRHDMEMDDENVDAPLAGGRESGVGFAANHRGDPGSKRYQRDPSARDDEDEGDR